VIMLIEIAGDEFHFQMSSRQEKTIDFRCDRAREEIRSNKEYPLTSRPVFGSGIPDRIEAAAPTGGRTFEFHLPSRVIADRDSQRLHHEYRWAEAA
jgi:hypothetical protein